MKQSFTLKRLLSIVMAFMMVFSSMPTAWAADYIYTLTPMAVDAGAVDLTQYVTNIVNTSVSDTTKQGNVVVSSQNVKL